MNVRLVSFLTAALLWSSGWAVVAGAQNGPPQQQQQQQQRPAAKPAPGTHTGNRPGAPAQGAGHEQRPGGAANQGSRPGGQANQAGAHPQPGGARPQENRPAGNQGANRPPQGNRPGQQVNRPGQAGNRPGTVRPGQRPPQWGRPPASRPTYNFRPNDRNYLRNYYASRLRGINRARRPVFRMGMYFPLAYIGYLQPVPASMWGMLPAIPPGYQVGYYDGYVVVYDPVTYWIVGVIDLM